MFFDSWSDALRVGVMALLAYAALIVTLRTAGKRTLAKMNAFDLVVTVALGSTLATILLNGQVSLLEGVLALVLLVALQFVSAWGAVRWSAARRLLKSRPTLLLHRGRMLPEAMEGQRVTAGEVRQAVRAQGIGGLEEVHAVVLETDGSFSVIPRAQAGSADALEDVPAPGGPRGGEDPAPRG
ncbi:YetF domain-containing protein [Streptomyces fradiae]|uniref:DUF421 domain-containing protein n=1 Tax=Streptomyces fradiae TaxID=1906 RepID=UPI003409AB71